MANEKILMMIGMDSLVSFAHNHNPGWIDEIWEGNMRDHFNNKWLGYCKDDGYGSVKAVLSFITSLDHKNRTMLFKHIIENYCKR